MTSSANGGTGSWRTGMRKFRVALRPVMRFAVSFVALAVAACSPSRVMESADVLADLGAGAGPSRLKRTTPAPHRSSVNYRVADRSYGGDIYRPGDGGAAALVLLPGVARAGKDDERLVAFANTLARAGFTVLVPDIVNLRALKVKSTDVRSIADAVRHLAAERKSRVGLVAVSYTAGPAVLAALQDDIRCRVGFVLTIGGYYDRLTILTYLTTGYYRERPDGPWRKARRDPYGMWVSILSYTDFLARAADRDALEEIVRRRVSNLDADIGDLRARLGPEGQAVYALIANRDPDRVPRLIAALPKAVRLELAALDLKGRDFSGFAAQLILIHGRDDAVIPYTESAALAAAVPAGRAALYLVDSLAHVDLGPTGVVDTFILWRALYRLLEERDALMQAPAGAAGCPGPETASP